VARLTTPALGDYRQPVLLDAARSTDADGIIVSFTYVFGDGTPAVTRVDNSVRHVFPGPGTFTLQLLVEDDAGQTSGLAREITLVEQLDPPYCSVDGDCGGTEQRCDVAAGGICMVETP
jgi:hypothetical protein